MYSENGVLVDFQEIKGLIESADVFAIGFGHCPERILVDTRSNGTEMPLVQVVEPAGSPQGRIEWLQRRRPSLGPPQAMSFFSWPHSAGFLVGSGIWQAVLDRVGAGTDPAVRVQCEVALQQMKNLERETSLAAITGDNFGTLWPPEQRRRRR